MTTVAFIGLGAMGSPMASNLLAAGFDLRVFNRNPAKTAELAGKGAVVCGSPADAAKGSQFVISIVSDDNATREVMLGANGVLAGAAPGTIIIDSSTNTPAMAREVAAAAKARGCDYLDSPVSGSVPQSRGAELVFMVGGDAQAFEKAQPIYTATGRMSTRMGEAGAGATIKLINNMLSGTVNTAIAEAVSIAEAAGLDLDAAYKVLNEGAAASRLTRTKMEKILKRDFSPQFQLALMEKDMRYFMALAQEVDRPTPVAAAVRNQLHAARRADLGGLDVSAVFLQVVGERSKS